MKHLIECGCKKIVHYAASKSLDIGMKRRKGYLDALNDHGLEINESYIIDCDSFDHALSCTTKLLSEIEDLDGIFAVNDLTAIGAIKQLKLLGKKIPQEVKVMGFTNDISSAIYHPSLSTVDQQGVKMGEEAAHLLLQNMDGIKRAQVKTISANLVIRESTCGRN